MKPSSLSSPISKTIQNLTVLYGFADEAVVVPEDTVDLFINDGFGVDGVAHLTIQNVFKTKIQKKTVLDGTPFKIVVSLLVFLLF